MKALRRTIVCGDGRPLWNWVRRDAPWFSQFEQGMELEKYGSGKVVNQTSEGRAGTISVALLYNAGELRATTPACLV